MEHLFTDQHAEELDRLAGIKHTAPVSSATASSAGSAAAVTSTSGVFKRLADLDEGYLIRSEFNYTNVVKTAIKTGFRIIPIDATRTYWGVNHIEGRNRHYALNYPAAAIINYYVTHHLKKGEKWIAFVGARHMVTQADALKNVEVQKDSPKHPALGIAELTRGRPALIESKPDIPKGEEREGLATKVLSKAPEADKIDEHDSPTAFTRLEIGTKTD